MKFCKKEMQELLDKGLTQAQVALSVGCHKSYVNQLIGTNCDVAAWEFEMKRHADFFKGLSPREEYAKHAEFRKTIDEF